MRQDGTALAAGHQKVLGFFWGRHLSQAFCELHGDTAAHHAASRRARTERTGLGLQKTRIDFQIAVAQESVR